jgi:hypothetical protein
MMIIRREINFEMANIACSICVDYHILCGGNGLF